MKTLKFAALVAAVALTAGGGLFALNSRAAQTARSDDNAGGKWRERIKEKLNLTDVQISRIKSQLKSEKGNITSLLSRLRDARSQLRAEIQKPDATESSVRAASAQVAAVQADIAVERLKLRAKISPILTADQRAKLDQLKAGIDQFVKRAIDRAKTRNAE
jgi:Spy/CpxP family protein refolding chaperone